MTEQEFRSFVNEALEDLYEQIDDIDSDDLDPTFSAGVLTVDFETGGTFVLSQQVPVQELWLSANRRAWHFKFDGQWRERDSSEPMTELLSQLFSEKLGMKIAF